MRTKSVLVLAVVVSILFTSSAFAGYIVAWGDNDYGVSDVPAGNDFVDIAPFLYCLACRADGSLKIWGYVCNNGGGYICDERPGCFVAVATPMGNNLALKADGSLLGWGNCDHGECDVPSGNDFVAIAGGDAFCLALRANGSLVAWGQNKYGDCDVPPGNDFVAIAARKYHCLALKADGSLAAWGHNLYGQCDVPSGNDFVAIAAGFDFSVALKANGSLVAWGDNSSGRCDVPAGYDFVDVSAGSGHGLAIRSDGSLAAWGWNDSGQCDVPAGNNFTAIAGGAYSSFALTSKPLTFVLLTPKGGESLIASETYTITWSNTGGSIINVFIEYSNNNGQDWNPVTPENAGNTGSYNWTVPAVTSQECLVRISDADDSSVNDTSDDVFEIYKGTLSVIKPNGDETLVAGQTYMINWSSTGSISDVLIEYSTNNGQDWSSVTPANVGNTGSYNWTVPPVNSQECLIRINDAGDSSVNDTSDDIFEIRECTLSLIRPNGGEAILKGITYDINWLSDLPAGNILIEYSTDNGEDWQTIATTEDTGSYGWQVTGPQSNQYLVRLSDVDGSGLTDTSDTTFTVYTCQEEIAGDLNGDCVVNMVDFALVAQNWLNQGYVRIFYSPLDTSHNWIMEGQWEFGAPTGNGGTENGNPDPSSGYTGSNVYGVNLNGDYSVAVGGPYCLIAGPFDCNKFHDMKLRFARWLNTDEPGYVASRIDVSNDGANWHNLWENTAAINDSNWQVVEYDVSGTADNEATVYFRWSYEILDDRAYPYSGWNIDDIELLGKF